MEQLTVYQMIRMVEDQNASQLRILYASLASPG